MEQFLHILLQRLQISGNHPFSRIFFCHQFTELNKEVSAGSGVRALGDFGGPQETFLAPPMVWPAVPQAGIHNPVGHSWC